MTINLFYSYAHEDEALRDVFETHLKLLQRQKVIDSWHDRKIDCISEGIIHSASKSRSIPLVSLFCSRMPK